MCECWHCSAGHAAKLLFSVGRWSGLSTATKDEFANNGVEVCAISLMRMSLWPQHARSEKKMQKAAALSYGCLEGAGGVRFKYSGKTSAVTHTLMSILPTLFIFMHSSRK